MPFIIAGANHFINTGFYVSIMPPYLPWHLELVYLSGVAEAGLGALLLFRRCDVSPFSVAIRFRVRS